MGRLNWRSIFDLDIQKLKANVEVTNLDSLLDNIVFADVTPDELMKLGENVLCKLVKVMQYSIEYLLFS